MANVALMIPNNSYSKIYAMQIGKRGGRSWKHHSNISASGVYLPDAEFSGGEWKVTSWVNGFPRIIAHFVVNADGTVENYI